MRPLSPLSTRRALVLLLPLFAAGACEGDFGELLRAIEQEHHHPPPPPAGEIALQLSGTDDVPGRNDDFVVLSPPTAEPRPFATLTVSLTGAASGMVVLSASGGGLVSFDTDRVQVAAGAPAQVRVYGERASTAVDDVTIQAQLAGGGGQATEDLTVIDGVSLAIAGHFQDRLATDPDPSNDPRGVRGSTRALEGEADLDGVIRFSRPADLRLACTFDPVRVTAVRATQPAGAEFVGGDDAIGAPLDLGPLSRFVDPQGDLSRERIDAFELHLGALDARGPDPIGGPIGFLRMGPVIEAIVADYQGRAALLATERAARASDDLEVRRIDARLALRMMFRYDTWQLRFTRPFCGSAQGAPPAQTSQLFTLLAGAGLDYRIEFLGFDADCLRGIIDGTLRPSSPGATPLCPPPTRIP
jgi:hypothetical protein